MAKSKTKKHEGADLLENPELLAGKAEEFFNESKNRNLVFSVGGVIALLVIAFLGYKYYVDDNNADAQQEMFQAVFYFEADSLNKALNGDGINLGFLDIIEEYPGTDAANLSKFYAGAAHLNQGNFTSATLQFEDFSAGDHLLQARAYALTGDAYSELQDYDKAITFYEKASLNQPNAEFTPIYLLKLATVCEAGGEFGKASAAYDKIIEKYSKSPFLAEAKKQKARLKGLAAK
ncbi:MAG: TolA-binding protein [Cyclobacteriaceae bacterium]|jgi:TolA-binding protein